MSILNRALSVTLLLLAASQIQANPIQDLSFNGYKAGWYPNFYQQQGPLNCRKTCSAWVGVVPEHEISNNLDAYTKRTSVCKVTQDPSVIIKPYNAPQSHWLYGNQFDAQAVCIVTDSAGKASGAEYFMCECAAP